ncbi:MAG: hypothetical protein UT41_C0003G0140 [Candidatus Wolfebacteria bacterium GW2011_GWC2_39_22]|uniref:Uncharacterized protein n=1 Tax=Candidatus Wolfebacteria bacterium GW2011_GWC2_39_22 TaxID=1619013 RepID=A0A0G0N9U1_9BACT|nr:MAG: hypothetical protein UT41_C0003G0140 [Candidatus Wolfebacteria bacterium GW2011_GWC2_39_22]HBI25171.1 hypothetical protein [Candidatus Wolfebacteria bacterium]
MRSIVSVILAAIILAIVSPSFAEEKKAVHEPRVIKLAEEKAPKIVRFSEKFVFFNSQDSMMVAELSMLTSAEKWMSDNRNVQIISHSVYGGYHAGYVSMTIIYMEK